MNPLEGVQAELATALAERSSLDRKIQTLQEAIKLLERIYGKQPTVGLLQEMAAVGDMKNLGITAAIERVLMCFPEQWLPPTSVRNALVEAGFELAGDNPLASIHQVLKRLVARGNWFVSQEIDGQTMYKYDSTKHPFPNIAVEHPGRTYRSGSESILRRLAIPRPETEPKR